MICKWCGEVLKPGDNRCKRCRRDVPALSDCGGFYDLVPQAGSPMPIQPVREPAPVVEEQPDRIAPIPVEPIRRKKNHTAKNLVFWVAIVLAVVFLVQTISLSGKLETAEAQIQTLKKRDDQADAAVNNVSASKPEVKPGQPTPPVEPEETLTVEYNGGMITIPFTDGNCAALKTQCVTVELRNGSETIAATITLELETVEDGARELWLMVSAKDSRWKDLSFRWSMAQDPAAELSSFDILAEDTSEEMSDEASDDASGSFFDIVDSEAAQAPQYTGSMLEIDWDGTQELICEITATDSTGETVRLVLTGIVIE